MTDRKAIAAAFRAAKPLLWDGVGSRGHRYICNALTHASHPASDTAKEIIVERLFPFSYLSSWVAEQIGVSRCGLPDASLQAHRHAWLDMLIAEFEGEEQ